MAKKRRISNEERARVKKKLAEGKSHRQVQRETGVGLATISKIRNEADHLRRIAKTVIPQQVECPVPRLRKADLIWLYKHKCNCGKRYIHHYECFLAEHSRTIKDLVSDQRIGFLDIEATNLKADFGVVICWCIKVRNSSDIIERAVTPREMKACLDRKAIEAAIEALSDFDRIVGHYSSRFDIPFLRTRALELGLKFPEYGCIYQTDTWRIARQKLCLSSNRLKRLGETLNIETEKTPITSKHWLKALTGSQNSIDYILDHCRRDVIILEAVWEKIHVFCMESNISI